MRTDHGPMAGRKRLSYPSFGGVTLALAALQTCAVAQPSAMPQPTPQRDVPPGWGMRAECPLPRDPAASRLGCIALARLPLGLRYARTGARIC
jgi:hypothetical protein